MLDIWKEYINPCLVAILQMSLPLLIDPLEFETNEKIGVNLSFVHPYRDFRTNLMPRRPRSQQHSHDECINFCNLWLTACGFCTRLLSVIAKADEYAKFDLAIPLPTSGPAARLLLLSCPSHNFSPLADACLCHLSHCGQVVSSAGLVY